MVALPAQFPVWDVDVATQYYPDMHKVVLEVIEIASARQKQMMANVDMFAKRQPWTYAEESYELKNYLWSRRWFVAVFSLSQIACAQQADPHGWLGTETFKTRFGDFQFKDGYPVGNTVQRLLELQTLNRAVEVYTTHLMAVSDIASREGLRAFGAKTPQQVVIWENLMDARTLLLTATPRPFTLPATSI